MADLQATIEDYWDRVGELDTADPEVVANIRAAIDLLDSGEGRIVDIDADENVTVNQWLKQAILLLFKVATMETIEVGPYEYADKIPLKKDFQKHGVRAVPGAIARWGSFHEPGVILMPSYTNIGARVGAGTMIDTWATVASCAQVGARTHIAGGVGLGGVLEPPNALPVIIGDDCMIGSRCMITQGARVRNGAVLGEGVILNKGIPVIDAETGETLGKGDVPAYAIAVQSWTQKEFPGGTFGKPCVLVIKRYAPGEREHLNDILREEGINPS